jgi:hypothetical protein
VNFAFCIANFFFVGGIILYAYLFAITVVPQICLLLLRIKLRQVMRSKLIKYYNG